MHEKLEQSQYEDLSAFLDGELPEARASEIRDLIASDPAWRDAHERLVALDDALGAYEPPAVPGDLAERIIRSMPQARPAGRWATVSRWVAPLAAAAAIVVAAVLLPRKAKDAQEAGPTVLSGSALVDERLEGVAERDRFVVENLEFFRDYDVLTNLETIEAVERLEAQTPDA